MESCCLLETFPVDEGQSCRFSSKPEQNGHRFAYTRLQIKINVSAERDMNPGHLDATLVHAAAAPITLRPDGTRRPSLRQEAAASPDNQTGTKFWYEELKRNSHDLVFVKRAVRARGRSQGGSTRSKQVGANGAAAVRRRGRGGGT